MQSHTLSSGVGGSVDDAANVAFSALGQTPSVTVSVFCAGVLGVEVTFLRLVARRVKSSEVVTLRGSPMRCKDESSVVVCREGRAAGPHSRLPIGPAKSDHAVPVSRGKVAERYAATEDVGHGLRVERRDLLPQAGRVGDAAAEKRSVCGAQRGQDKAAACSGSALGRSTHPYSDM